MRSKPSHPTSCQLLLASMLFIPLANPHLRTLGYHRFTDVLPSTLCAHLALGQRSRPQHPQSMLGQAWRISCRCAWHGALHRRRQDPTRKPVGIAERTYRALTDRYSEVFRSYCNARTTWLARGFPVRLGRRSAIPRCPASGRSRCGMAAARAGNAKRGGSILYRYSQTTCDPTGCRKRSQKVHT